MRYVLITGLVLVLTACNKPSPHDELVDALKTARSWTATAQMVGEAWQQGAVPDQYARQTLSKSQEEIGKAIEPLSVRPAVVGQVQHTIQEMAKDIEQQNKTTFAASLKTISNEQQQLNALAKVEGASP